MRGSCHRFWRLTRGAGDPRIATRDQSPVTPTSPSRPDTSARISASRPDNSKLPELTVEVNGETVEIDNPFEDVPRATGMMRDEFDDAVDDAS